MNKTHEERIEDLYKEFDYKKSIGMNPDKEIYKRRKKFLEIAIEERNKHESHTTGI